MSNIKVLTEPAFDDRVHALIDEHIDVAIDAGLASVDIHVQDQIDAAIAAQDLLTPEEAQAQIDTSIAGLASRDEVTAALDELNGKIDGEITDAITAVQDQVDTVDGRVTALDTKLSDQVTALDTRLSAADTALDTAVKAVDTRVSGLKIPTTAQIDTQITAKGYTTPTAVDAQIAAKGYITATAVDAAITAKTQTLASLQQLNNLDTKVTALATKVDSTEVITRASVDAMIADQLNTKDLATLTQVNTKIDAVTATVLTPAQVDTQIAAQLAAQPPASAGLTRKSATVTQTIAAGADVAASFTLATAYSLLSISTSLAARVRLYATSAAASADAARLVTDDPGSDAGLVMEYVTAAGGAYPITPTVTGASVAAPPSTTVAARITNLSASSASVTVTLTYLALEN